MIIKPAYGRDYKSPLEAIDDFFDGKDFVIMDVVGKYGQWNGSYVSVRDFTTSMMDDFVEIRFGDNLSECAGISMKGRAI